MDGIKIHACCGKRILLGWVHADIADFPHIDHKDIFNLPYGHNSVSEIYCAHGIAYFDRPTMWRLLSHWRDILKPEGRLRLATPNFNTIVKMYSGGTPLEVFRGLLYGRMAVNEDFIFHKAVYDFQSLSRLLNEAEFKDVKRYNWKDFLPEGYDDHSRAYLPPFDFKNGTSMSLNVVCQK